MADHSTLTKPSPNLLPFSYTRKTMFFAYGFMLTFLICTIFILFNPTFHSSPLEILANFRNRSFLSSQNGSHIFSYHFPKSSHSNSGNNVTSNVADPPFFTNGTNDSNFSTSQDGNFDAVPAVNQTQSSNFLPVSETQNSDEVVVGGTLGNSSICGNDTTQVMKRDEEGSEFKGEVAECNIFDGNWVRDETYPLYEPGSCPHIDEPFNCFLNYRPDNGYERYRWQPNDCNIPRLNGTHMLELLRGKRLVFVGDSLNRNMWESLVCILRNSVEDKRTVFEASGRQEFRSEGSYSFIFADYNCSVEFFRTPFLVQEWEVLDKNGSKTETLRLDLVESSSDRYRDADVLIFNTGHWWSHEKTSRGQGYYQEGSHVYDELNVIEAFRRALTTWARWVDANVDHKKTQVFFRGYSSSHFGGGKWNSGGRCDEETEPFKDDAYLESYPSNMIVLEDVLRWMKMPVFYLNITRLTDFRKDAHPAIYRAQHLSEEERRSPLRYQDCSHWCLPGVPDTWNEIVYSQMLIRHHQRLEEEQQIGQRR